MMLLGNDNLDIRDLPSIFLAMSKLTTKETFFTSIPRPATSVATKTSALPSLICASANSLQEHISQIPIISQTLSAQLRATPLKRKAMGYDIPLLLRFTAVQCNGVVSRFVDGSSEQVDVLLLVNKDNDRCRIVARVEQLHESDPIVESK
jgi:hypothetical protein